MANSVNFHIAIESGGTVYISKSVHITWEVESSFAAFGGSSAPEAVVKYKGRASLV